MNIFNQNVVQILFSMLRYSMYEIVGFKEEATFIEHFTGINQNISQEYCHHKSQCCSVILSSCGSSSCSSHSPGISL